MGRGIENRNKCGVIFASYKKYNLNLQKIDEDMPTLLTIFGLRFFFYTREQEPIHVHVEHADGVAKYNLLDDRVELVENKGLKPA